MKLQVWTNWSTGETIIDMVDITPSKAYVIGQKNGKLIRQEVDELGQSPKKLYHLLVIPQRMSLIFFKEMADYLSGQNIKTENENLMQGKLQATEKHLEDMRKHFETVLNKMVDKL